MTTIYTGQIAKRHDYAKAGLIFIDTTVKSGIKAFAPTWDIVMDVKAGKITELEYTKAYRQLMGLSYKHNQNDWIELLSSEAPVVICCYCPEGKFCHRHVLLGYLVAAGHKHGLPVNAAGEFGVNAEPLPSQLGFFDNHG
jgi:hypothetical protein